MAVTTCVGGNPFNKGKGTYAPSVGGTILGGGTIKSSAIWNTPTMASMGTKGATNHTTPVSGSNGVTAANLSATKFGVEGQFIMTKYTTKLAGVANTVLQFAGASRGGYVGIHAKYSPFNTPNIGTAIRSGDWNIFSGKFVPALTNSSASFATDSGATPTYAIPGELVYSFGTRVPHTQNYQKRTN